MGIGELSAEKLSGVICAGALLKTVAQASVHYVQAYQNVVLAMGGCGGSDENCSKELARRLEYPCQ